MSQNDFTIANQTFPNTRADINSALQALASTSSGGSAPSTTFANQFFYNTTSNLLQIRNEANDAFITIAELDQANDTVEYFKSDSIRTALIEFTDGDDALAIADGGALTVSTSLDMNGTELILDADADTSVTADTDDRVDFKVGGADVAYITKNDIGGIINRMNAKPLIINGDMQIAQRGTSTTGITTSGYYTVDRFAVTINALGTWTQTQDTTVPTAKGFSKSLKMDCTTADASPASGDLVLLSYKIEAQDLQLLKYGTSSAEAVTLRFHVRSPKTGTHIVHLYQNDGNRHISKAYTISSADTYQEVIINIEGDTGGTTNNDNACGLQIEFYLAAGSNSTSGTLATSWAGYTQANSAVGQVNCADNTANNFFITGLQMEVGEYDATTMPPFQHELFGDSLMRCQRYFQKYTQPPLVGIANANNTYARAKMLLQTQMRSAPTAVHNGTFNYFVSNSIQPTTTAFSATYLDENVAEFDATTNVTSMTAKDPITLIQNGSASLDLSAEL